MRSLVIFVLCTLFLFFWLKRKLERKLLNFPGYGLLESKYDKLLLENKRLKEINSDLQNTVEATIALYDITKQLCKSLDGDLVFSYFKEEINKYIRVKDCKFLKKEADLLPYKDYANFPLRLGDRLIGYLAVDGLESQDKEKFDILSQQFLLGIKRAVLYQDVQELTIIDDLTQVSNRRYYLERFKEELARSKKFDYNFCCLMIDIDYFKDYNDRYGHIVGDVILKELAKSIQQNIRQIDLMGRYGGEEFSLILSQANKETGQLAAERIRQAIEGKRIRAYDEELKITVSIGISVFPFAGKDIKTLIDRADLALYQAKEKGRNRVCIYEN